jgi:hypothetical protein
MGVETALVIGTIFSAGATVYSTQQSKSAAAKARREARTRIGGETAAMKAEAAEAAKRAALFSGVPRQTSLGESTAGRTKLFGN